MDLEKLVEQPTWKEMLIDLVYTEKLNPWNIDIIEITDKFMDKVRNVQMLDLRIPANLILASSILLRFKSDAIRLEEEEQIITDETYIGEGGPVEVPMIQLRTRIPPKRMVTLDELVDSIETVFDEINERAEDRKVREEEIKEKRLEKVQLELKKYDIELEMRRIFDKALLLADKKNMVTFSSLLEKRTNETIIKTLLPVLHLAQDGKFSIFQEELFQEIFIIVKTTEPPVIKGGASKEDLKPEEIQTKHIASTGKKTPPKQKGEQIVYSKEKLREVVKNEIKKK